MKSLKRNLTLDNSSISEAVQLFEELLLKAGAERKNAIGLRLSLEEILLCWQKRFGPEKQFTLNFTGRFRQSCISLSLQGEPCDPTAGEDAENDLIQRILSNLGLALNWEYRKNTNRVWIRTQKAPKKPLARLLTGVCAALLLGAIGLMLFPEAAAGAISLLIEPLRSTLFSLLGAVATPLIFLSVMLGICGSGDMSSFGKIGKRILITYLAISALGTAAIGLLALPFFPLNMARTSLDTSQFGEIINLLLDILPRNIFEPFLSGNTLQLIVLAVAIGIAVLSLGSRADHVVQLAEQLRSVVERMLGWITALLPFMIFLVLLEMAWSGQLNTLAGIWKPLLLIAVAISVIILFRLLHISRRFHLRPLRLLRLLLPTTMIGLSTSSSSVAFNTNLECCERDLGIHPRIARIGVPLGTVLFSPAGGATFMLFALYCASQFGTECSAAWIFIALFSSFLYKMAAPPVGGGNIACIAVLFAQMGIPESALAIVMTMDIIADRLNTACKLSLMQLELIAAADKMELLDRETLQRNAG